MYRRNLKFCTISKSGHPDIIGIRWNFAITTMTSIAMGNIMMVTSSALYMMAEVRDKAQGMWWTGASSAEVSIRGPVVREAVRLRRASEVRPAPPPAPPTQVR